MPNKNVKLSTKKKISPSKPCCLHPQLYYRPPLNTARPQPTSRPAVPQKEVQARQVLLSWEPGSDGLSPVRYYTVQLRELPESNWSVHSASVKHEDTNYIVSG